MFIFLFCLWLVFNARITVDVVIVGLVMSFALDLFARKICGWSVSFDKIACKNILRLFKYAFLLFIDIIKANIDVIKIILSPKLPSEKPHLFFFDTKLKTQTAKLLLANTITITPGTYTVGIYDSTFAVHALTPKFEEGVLDSTFNRQLKNIEKLTLEE